MRDEQHWAVSTSVAALANRQHWHGRDEKQSLFCRALVFSPVCGYRCAANRLPPCSFWEMGPGIPRLCLSLHRSCRSRQRVWSLRLPSKPCLCCGSSPIRWRGRCPGAAEDMPSSPVEIPMWSQRASGPLSAAGCIHGGSGTAPWEAQHSTLLCGTCGNPDLCFCPASPSCLGECLYLFCHLSASAISPFLSYLQSAPERADTDAEHPQPALPPSRAGGALPLELLGSRYLSCLMVPAAPWWRAGNYVH